MLGRVFVFQNSKIIDFVGGAEFCPSTVENLESAERAYERKGEENGREIADPTLPSRPVLLFS